MLSFNDRIQLNSFFLVTKTYLDIVYNSLNKESISLKNEIDSLFNTLTPSDQKYIESCYAEMINENQIFREEIIQIMNKIDNYYQLTDHSISLLHEDPKLSLSLDQLNITLIKLIANQK